MRILILGGDGYLGWPTAMYLSAKGHEVSVADNMLRRRMHLERSTDSLTPIKGLQQRIEAWEREGGEQMRSFVGDLCDPAFANHIVEQTLPEAIIHYGEQPSAPYSMIDREHAVFSQRNNVEGNLNILFAMKEHVPDCHLVKLGTMGEYGTPNIDIEEGYIEIEHNGRHASLPEAAGFVLSPVEGARHA
jgi:UDP-sulfoquinovose synthase